MMNHRALMVLLFTIATIIIACEKFEPISPADDEVLDGQVEGLTPAQQGQFLRDSLKLPELWGSGNLEVKRSIQKMVFPDGILYDFKNDDYRTTRINSIFSVIPSLSVKNKHKKNGNKTDFSDYSRLVLGTGLEPVRP